MGSRYGGLKQLDELGPGGETIIDYSVYDAARAGFGKVVFIIRQQFESEFREKVSDKYGDVIQVEHVYQEIDTMPAGFQGTIHREKPWGTGHAMLMAKDVTNEPFAVINADDYYGAAGFRKMADFLMNEVSPSHYCMVGYVLANTLSDHGSVSRGVCQTNDEHLLEDVVERTRIAKEEGKIRYYENDTPYDLDPRSIVSMNFWGFHPNIFEFTENYFLEFAKENANKPRAEFYIPLLVNRMLQEDAMKMTVLESEDQWFGVTYSEDKPIVAEAFGKLATEGTYPNPIW